MTTAKPIVRPTVPHFSSGPCAKRPGWSLSVLTDALLGRSHRSKIGRAKLKRAEPKNANSSSHVKRGAKGTLALSRARDYHKSSGMNELDMHLCAIAILSAKH
jgi:hypothetical protein